ncbi:MAG: ABC transporter substrate-binding protein [Gammaproteobacteria bacterium]|nr:ABC transporter substrate-binding protein [Gammaproteobacteria bacterium]
MNYVRNLITTGMLSAALLAPAVWAEDPVRGGTLIQAIENTPRHLNPAVQSGIATGEPGTQLFAAPLRYDDDWTPQPYLAKSWEVSEDGLSVTLNLIEGATFHDGEPITSKDVAFSIKTIQENHPFKAMFAPVTAVETPDDNTAVLKLSKPHPALLLAMSSQLCPIIPEHIYGDGQDPKAHPANSEGVVGSGPFKLVEFKRDEHIILERNENFFIEGRPYLDKIVMRIIKDPSARAIALETGEVHLSGFQQNPQDINRLKKAEGVVVNPEGYAAIGPLAWLAFNTAKGPTADVKVRQAIAYAVDRNFINKAIMLGTTTPAATGIHPGSPFYEPDVENYDLDLDKANALLDEAGYAKDDDGIRFGLTVDYGWAGIKAPAEYIKPQLKKIGIAVTVRAAPDFPTWANRISNHDFDMTWDVVFNWGDPVIGVHRTYQSSNIKKGVIWSNTQSYQNAEVDEILEAAGAETDPAKRKELYSRFQKIVADEVPVYWAYTLPYHTISSEKVGNAPEGIWATSSPMDRVYLKQ